VLRDLARILVLVNRRDDEIPLPPDDWQRLFSWAERLLRRYKRHSSPEVRLLFSQIFFCVKTTRYQYYLTLLILFTPVPKALWWVTYPAVCKKCSVRREFPAQKLSSPSNCFLHYHIWNNIWNIELYSIYYSFTTSRWLSSWRFCSSRRATLSKWLRHRRNRSRRRNHHFISPCTNREAPLLISPHSKRTCRSRHSKQATSRASVQQVRASVIRRTAVPSVRVWVRTALLAFTTAKSSAQTARQSVKRHLLSTTVIRSEEDRGRQVTRISKNCKPSLRLIAVTMARCP